MTAIRMCRTVKRRTRRRRRSGLSGIGQCTRTKRRRKRRKRRGTERRRGREIETGRRRGRKTETGNGTGKRMGRRQSSRDYLVRPHFSTHTHGTAFVETRTCRSLLPLSSWLCSLLASSPQGFEVAAQVHCPRFTLFVRFPTDCRTFLAPVTADFGSIPVLLCACYALHALSIWRKRRIDHHGCSYFVCDILTYPVSRVLVRNRVRRLVIGAGSMRQGLRQRDECEGSSKSVATRVQVRVMSSHIVLSASCLHRGGEPSTQLAAARLWAIMLRNCSLAFVKQCASRKFLDSLEDVLKAKTTPPVVRERLIAVLAAASYASDSGT